MARMPVLAVGMMMLVMALTTGCQSTSPRKPSPTAVSFDNQKKQATGGQPNLANSGATRFPPGSAPYNGGLMPPPPGVQPVGVPSNPNLSNLGGPPGPVSPYNPPRTNTYTQPGGPESGTPPLLPVPPQGVQGFDTNRPN